MSGSLVCLAAALLSWPVRRGPALVRGGSAAVPAWGVGPLPRQVRLPVLAACGAAGAVACLSTVLVACLAGLCSALAARAWQARRREARAGDALIALAELLSALAAELRSGRPMDAALDAALPACGDEECRRLAEPVLRAASRDGFPPGAPAGADGAVAEALSRVAGAITLSGRTGCSLAAVLGAVEDDLRARHRHALEARTATAGPRASAALLAGLPLLALAMGGGVGADPWRVLTTTAPGQALLVIGVLLEIVGTVWSARLVRRAVR